MASNDFDPEPPPGPPPLLTSEQIKHLAYQGWLAVDLPDHLSDALGKLSGLAASFFDQDHDVKRNLYPPSRGTECGFYHVADEKEYITIRHVVDETSELEARARQVWRNIGTLLHRILCDLSRAGGYSLLVWDHLLEGSLDLPRDDSDMDSVTTLLRLFRYYPTAGVAEKHVDLGLLTLCIGSSKGLQVLDRSKDQPEWIDAQGPTVLIGDMARSLMRNQVRAGLHRVVGNTHGRSSTVLALRPYLKGATDLSAFGGHGIVDTKEYFAKIKGKKYNINATRDIRARQQNALRKQESVNGDSHQVAFGQG